MPPDFPPVGSGQSDPGGGDWVCGSLHVRVEVACLTKENGASEADMRQ
jgi:hypothetical protein